MIIAGPDSIISGPDSIIDIEEAMMSIVETTISTMPTDFPKADTFISAAEIIISASRMIAHDRMAETVRSDDRVLVSFCLETGEIRMVRGGFRRRLAVYFGRVGREIKAKTQDDLDRAGAKGRAEARCHREIGRD